jgi:hypothetical protein
MIRVTEVRDRPNDRPIAAAVYPAASAARIARSRSRRVVRSQRDCSVRRSRSVSPPQMPEVIRLVMA